MDGASIGTAILVTIILVVSVIIGCCGICCCCFAIPLFRIIGSLCWPSSKGSVAHQTNAARTGQPEREYELVSSGSVESGYQRGVYLVDPSAPPTDDLAVAEAYLVPPLAEVHTINADQIIGGDDSSRLQELQLETAEHKDGGFRDVWAAILFILNVLIIVYLAVQSVYIMKYNFSSESSNSADESSNKNVKFIELIAVFTLILTATAGAVGSWVLSFLMNHAENLIELVMWGSIGVQGICAILCLLSLQLIGALIFAVLAGLNYWYLLSVRPQIPFASSVLATACTALKANYTGLFTTAFSALFVQMVWIFLWVVAFAGVVYVAQDAANRDNDASDPSIHSHGHHKHDDDDIQQPAVDDHTSPDGHHHQKDASALLGFYYFLLCVSLFWGIQVIKSVVQTTVAGTLACWWFQPQRQSPVRGSLFRAMTTSFGSICFGSLIVAIIQALREVLHEMRRRAQGSSNNRDRSPVAACLVGILLMVLDFLMDLLEQAVMYFNKYAYCYVAAYGLGFVQSGRLVTSLFTNRGWTAIINDNLISRALMCGVLALTVCNMIIGVVVSFIFALFVASTNHDMGTLALVGGIVGAVAGLIVGIVLTNALDSAVAMVFVCFAEDPLALQKNHPQTYEALRSHWQALHPSTLLWCSACAASPSPMHSTSSAASSTAHHHQQHYSGGVAPSTGGVGGTGGGNVGIVYPIPAQVYTPPPALQQQQQQQAKPTHLYAPLQASQPAVVNPYHSSPYSSGSGYGGYGGYGYGAASSVGAQGSPSSSIYNPNYNGAQYYGNMAPSQRYTAPSAPTSYQPPVTVAHPALDPSAPPSYY